MHQLCHIDQNLLETAAAKLDFSKKTILKHALLELQMLDKQGKTIIT
jgi:hypothetical protein